MMGGDGRARLAPGRTLVRVVLGAAPTSVAAPEPAPPFSRENGSVAGTVSRMRAGALAAVSIVAACLGAAAVLVVASAAGWVGGESGVRTVVVPTAPADSGTAAPTAAPLVGNGFDPARIYASRSGGRRHDLLLLRQRPARAGLRLRRLRGGHILTNSHVVTNSGAEGSAVKGADRLYVVFHDGDRIPARSSAGTSSTTPASSRSTPKDHAVSPVPLGDSSSVVVGEPVAAIGSPFGQESSLAVGVVSATERSIESLTSAYDVSDAIQIDAPINHGNSGGPLLDARGA